MSKLFVKIHILFTLYTVSYGLASVQPSRNLYRDQADALKRRGEIEYAILQPKQVELLAPDLLKTLKNAPKGTGFSSNAASLRGLLGQEQANVMHTDGVIRINNCLSKATTTELRKHVLLMLEEARLAVRSGIRSPKEVFGIDMERTCRADVLLSLTKHSSKDTSHPVAAALNELLGEKGALRSLFENLVTKDGVLYEMAATVTEPGSERQMIHCDVPFHKIAPLYVVFAALQDVTVDMGPTTFIKRTQTEEMLHIWNDHTKRDDLLRNSTPKLALLKCGDVVVFDARALHCGNANQVLTGSTRAFFNFSFTNANMKDNLGNAGSLTPHVRFGYEHMFSLEMIMQLCKEYASHPNKDPFAKFGDGLL